MKNGIFITTIFAGVMGAQIASADGHDNAIAQSARDCDFRPATGSFNDGRLDINQLLLQETSLKVGCYLSLRDRGLIDAETLKDAIRQLQTAIPSVLDSLGDHNIELQDNYDEPDGIIGPNFVEDYSAAAYYLGYFEPYLKDDQTAYGSQNINSFYMQRFALELRSQNPNEFDATQDYFYADFDDAPSDRFLDDQQIRCTGENSLPDYQGPCGTSIATYYVEEPLRPSQTTVTYGARFNV